MIPFWLPYLLIFIDSEDIGKLIVQDIFFLEKIGKRAEECLKVVGILLIVLNEEGALEGSTTKLVSNRELEHLCWGLSQPVTIDFYLHNFNSVVVWIHIWRVRKLGWIENR